MSKNKKDNAIQQLARIYLCRLKSLASKYGLSKWLDNIVEANNKEQCTATIEDVDMLSRMVNEERINRTDVPKVLGISYRKCVDKEVFEKDVRNLGHQGTYSNVDTILEAYANYGKLIDDVLK